MPLPPDNDAELAERFLTRLVERTDNFGQLTWLGQPIWQNLLDLWTTQETIWSVRPALLVETGTNRGGSAYFFAHLFDLMGHGRVLTCDVEPMHEIEHARIEFVIGGSTEPRVFEHAQVGGPRLRRTGDGDPGLRSHEGARRGRDRAVLTARDR